MFSDSKTSIHHEKNNTEAISRLLPVTLCLMSPCVSLPLIILDQQPCLVCSFPQDEHFTLCNTKVAFNKHFLTFLRGRAVTETGIIWLVVVNVSRWSQKTKLSLASWLEWIARSTWGEKPQQWWCQQVFWYWKVGSRLNAYKIISVFSSKVTFSWPGELWVTWHMLDSKTLANI